MIDKKISVSEQVSNLSVLAQLIFTWSIPHADDLGLLPSSTRTLRAMIVPMLDIELLEFSKCLDSIVSEGLYIEFEYKGKKYYRIQKFLDHQTLKKDRKPNTYLPDVISWEEVEQLGFHMEDSGTLREEKRSKEKRSKDMYSSLTFLSETPMQELIDLAEKYKISPEGIKSKATDLKLYCEQKGKVYKNYRSFLENAIRKDKQKLQQQFPYERKVEAPPPEEISEEQRLKNAELRAGISQMLKSKNITT